MLLNVGFAEIFLMLIALAIIAGGGLLVARFLIGAGRNRESVHLQRDRDIVRQLEDVQNRLLDLEERMDSSERLFAERRQQIPRK
jgi:hypothetical protein